MSFEMLGFDVRHDVNSNPIFSYLVFFFVLQR